MTDINDLVTISDFAKEISVTGQTVSVWVEKHNADRDENFGSEGVIVPAAVFGNTRVYLRKTLLELAADKGNSKAVKAAGYVHPDKFAEMERNYFEAITRVGGLRNDLANAADRLAAMEIERDHFEKLSSEREDEIGTLENRIRGLEHNVSMSN